MNLIFLYGPPAVGKLTIAKELQKKINYKVLHNHLLINIFEDIFPFHHPSRNKLVREFRLNIIEEVIKENIDLIITAGTAGGPTLYEYYTKLIKTVENSGGNVYMVHLIADEVDLFNRVEDNFRKQYGKNFGKKEMEEMLKDFPSMFSKHPLKDHLEINTSIKTPIESTEEIINYYKLIK